MLAGLGHHRRLTSQFVASRGLHPPALLYQPGSQLNRSVTAPSDTAAQRAYPSCILNRLLGANPLTGSPAKARRPHGLVDMQAIPFLNQHRPSLLDCVNIQVPRFSMEIVSGKCYCRRNDCLQNTDTGSQESPLLAVRRLSIKVRHQGSLQLLRKSLVQTPQLSKRPGKEVHVHSEGGGLPCEVKTRFFYRRTDEVVLYCPRLVCTLGDAVQCVDTVYAALVLPLYLQPNLLSMRKHEQVADRRNACLAIQHGFGRLFISQ